MAITDAIRTRDSKAAAPGGTTAQDAGGTSQFRPVPVWFFAFEGLMGASFDIIKSAPHAWIFVAGSVVLNIVLARTVLRGRLKMAKAMLKGKRTRTIAAGLIALRLGVHVALGAAGMQAASGPAHIALAAVMCAATVGLLAFDQRVMLRALAAA
jgi:hypothetical protein